MDDDGGGGGVRDQGSRVRWRLAGMMALIYMVQGSWWPMLAVHLEDLGLSGRARGWIFATFALAAMATPLGAGQVADRWMPTQRLLSVIYVLGAVLLAVLGAGPTARPELLFGLFLVYWLITAPGYGLANSLAFRNLDRPARQFGGVRLWGTVGWMTVGWVVTGVLALGGETGRGIGPGVPEVFWAASGLSALFAVYCLTLPHTPPLASAAGIVGRRGLDLREALTMARQGPVAVFLITAFLVFLTIPFMYQVEPGYLLLRGLNREWVPLAMTINQLFEILALALLPVLHRRLGTRGTLALGVGAWLVHYGVLAARPPLEIALAALLLNGLGIACFVITGQMFLDEQAPRHLRASAQALYVVVATGLGSFLGSVLAGEIVSWNGGIGAPVFVVPALANLAALGLLALRFRPVAPPITSISPGPSPGGPAGPSSTCPVRIGEHQTSEAVG